MRTSKPSKMPNIDANAYAYIAAINNVYVEAVIDV